MKNPLPTARHIPTILKAVFPPPTDNPSLLEDDEAEAVDDIEGFVDTVEDIEDMMLSTSEIVYEFQSDWV